MKNDKPIELIEKPPNQQDICIDQSQQSHTTDKENKNLDSSSNTKTKKSLTIKNALGNELVSKQETVDIKALNSLKSFFDTLDIKVVVKKIIRATKKPYSRELEIIMGEEYPYFQGLTRKEKVAHLCERIILFHRLEMEFIKNEQRRAKGKKERVIRKKALDNAMVEKDAENKIVPLLKELGHLSLIANINYSALTNLSSQDHQSHFSSIMSYWKTIESSGGKSTDEHFLDPIGSGEPSGDLRCFEHYKQRRYNILYVSVAVLVLVILLVLLLYYLGVFSSSSPEEVKTDCGFFCRNFFIFLLLKSLEFII